MCSAMSPTDTEPFALRSRMIARRLLLPSALSTRSVSTIRLTPINPLFVNSIELTNNRWGKWNIAPRLLFS